MKASIHPNYHSDTKVTCVCGNTFVSGSILPEIKVEICAACHPFFTGEVRYVDTQGRIEIFERRRKSATPQTRTRKQVKAPTTPIAPPKSLKEMLSQKKV